MKYIFDSNCFIQPHKTFCPTDVGLSFWMKIRELAQYGIICSLDKVKNELYANSDELKEWMCTNLGDDFFYSTSDQNVANQLQRIILWASSSTRYFPKAKEKFLRMDKADIYLAAFAASNPQEWKVVSMEQPAPNNHNEIKLPDVCQTFGVSCIKPQDMFRELRQTF